MIRFNKIRAFFFVSFLASLSFFPPLPAHAEDTALIIDFADWLHSGGDDVSAEAEYLRYLFVTGSADARAVSALALIYRTRGDSEKLLSLSDKYLPLINDQRVAGDLSYFRGYSLLRLERWPPLDDMLNSLPVRTGNSNSFFALSLASNIYRGNLKEAKTIIRANNENKTAEADDPLISLEKELAIYSPKNRAVAVGLSALVPGLGKAYAHQYGDAFFSFAVTSTLAALTAYTAYSEGALSWKPWVYGAGAGIFYSANLYGSAQAAARYNETHEKILKSKVDEILAQYPR